MFKSSKHLIQLLLIILFPFFTNAQNTEAEFKDNLFSDTALLHIKLYANFKNVQKDRNDNPAYHAALLKYKNADSSEVEIPVKIKARGNFRKDRSNCVFPPLYVNFPKHNIDSAGLFGAQKRLKLVTHCQGDQYVIYEWLAYKLYNMLTPKSFLARLVKVDYIDSASRLKQDTHYGIFLEGEDEMAKRNETVIIHKKLVEAQATEHKQYLIMTIFEYMIGNTDCSIQFLHNVRLISADSTKVPYTTVAYDFDHSGIVNAPYAQPPEQLDLKNVQERLFRGYCLPYTDFDETVKLFDSVKTSIYDAYTKCTLLQPRYVKQTIAYLDDFYKTINNKKLRLVEFGKPCSLEGKQNVLIKGLKGSD